MSANALLALMGEESKVKTTGDTGDDEAFKCTGIDTYVKKLSDDSYVVCGVNSSDYTLDSDLISASTSISGYTDDTVYQVMKGEPLSLYTKLTNYGVIGAFAQTKTGDTHYSYVSGFLRKRDITDPVIDERITAVADDFPSTSQGALCVSETGSLYLLPTRFSSEPLAGGILGVETNPTDLAVKCPLNVGVGWRKIKAMYDGYLYLGEDNVLYSIGNTDVIKNMSSTEVRVLRSFVKDFEHLGNNCIVVLTTFGELVYYGKTSSCSVYTMYNFSYYNTDDEIFLEGGYLYDTRGRLNMTTRHDVYGNPIEYTIAKYESNWINDNYVNDTGVVLAKGVKKIVVENYVKYNSHSMQYIARPYACITQKNELVVFGNALFTYDDNSFMEDSNDSRFANGSKIIDTGVSDAFIAANALYYIKDGKTYVIGNNFCDMTGLGETFDYNTKTDYVLTKYAYAYTCKAPLYFTEPQLFSESPMLTCCGSSPYYEYGSETSAWCSTLQRDGSYRSCAYKPGYKTATEITYGEKPIVHLT
jgi:hypothetical protein